MRKVYGVGISDLHPVKVDGKHLSWYTAWVCMLKRCYGFKHLQKCQTYIGCEVCDEWKTASNFKAWYDEYHVEGFHLDKDLLGDKLYSPETCCFVPQWLNSLLTDCRAARGQWPQGVTYDKRYNKFVARLRVDNRKCHIGHFDTPQAASKVYIEAKTKYVFEKTETLEPRLRDAVRNKWLLQCQT